MPVVTLVLSSTMAYVCARVLLFRSEGVFGSWAERARVTFPVRSARTIVPWTCFGFLLIFFHENHNPLLDISVFGIAALLFPATLLSLIVADRAIAPLIGSVRTWKRSFKQTAGALLLSPGRLLIAITLYAMPNDFSMRALVVASFGFAALAVLSIVGTLELLCRVGLAQTASSSLLAAVGQAGRAVGISPSAVFEIDLPVANAFALLFPRQLVFTRRAVEILDHEKLVAVACHELAHLAEPQKVRWLALAQVLIIYPVVFSGIVYGHFGLGGIILLIALYALVRKRITAMRRGMEARADAAGHQHEPYAGTYAAALEALYQENQAPAVLRVRRAHGSLYDRMIAAGVTPAFERPAPPSYLRSFAPFVISLGLLSGLQLGFDRWSDRVDAAVGTSQFSDEASMWHLAIGIGGARTIAQIAESRELHGSPEQAVVLFRAASELDDDSVFYPARLATVLASLGRCNEAYEAWSDAETNLRYFSYREIGAAHAEASAKSAVLKCASMHGNEEIGKLLETAD